MYADTIHSLWCSCFATCLIKHGMFMPRDHEPRIFESATQLAEVKVANQLNAKYMGSRSTIGAGGHAVGYMAHGTANDFYRFGFQIPSVQTWEIYGDEYANYYDCFHMFNPYTDALLLEYKRNWTAMILDHIAYLQEGHVPLVHGAPADRFTQEIAHMPFPKACGLDETHLKLLHRLEAEAGVESPQAKREEEDAAHKRAYEASMSPEDLAEERARKEREAEAQRAREAYAERQRIEQANMMAGEVAKAKARNGRRVSIFVQVCTFVALGAIFTRIVMRRRKRRPRATYNVSNENIYSV